MPEQQLSVGDIVPKPPEPRPEAEIIADWEGDFDKPLVSIKCLTYNHFPYIADALNGILMQKTDFPFEIWVHDDASTDETQKIVKNYKDKYPNIIKVIFQMENQYSRSKKPLSIIEEFCRGKYCARCEGDDYWADPEKLQKQVSYLESHPACVITGHDALIVDDKRTLKSLSKLPRVHQRDCSERELIEGKARILTVSWVYRNIVREFAPERHKVNNGDTFFTAILGEYGSSHYHADIKPAAYRVHGGGVWSSLDNADKLDTHMNTWFWMYRYFKRIGKDDVSSVFLSRFKHNALKKMSDLDLIKEIVVRLTMARTLKQAISKLLGPSGVQRIKKLLSK